MYANAPVDPGPSLGHSRLCPSPSTIYKEGEKALTETLQYQVQRTALVAQDQHRTNTPRERTPSGENSLLDRPYVPWVSPYAPPPYPCVGHYSPPSPFEVFFCQAESLDPSVQLSGPLWPSRAAIAVACSKFLGGLNCNQYLAKDQPLSARQTLYKNATSKLFI